MAEPAAPPPFRCGHVAIVGRPNVGKSTLLNHFVGQKVSITSKKAQTTRHRVTGILTTERAQFIFVDTPGFQTLHRSKLNERMNKAVTQSLGDVDAVVLVIEAGRTVEADLAVARLLPSGAKAVVALNKVDQLKDKDALLPQMAALAALYPFAAIVPVSAEKERSLDRLLAEVAALLPTGAPLYGADELTDRDERFLAAEFIREKIFRLLGEELPYAASVAIDRFVEEDGVRHINATVYVERDNQRAILLGAGGSRMKEIASKARVDMERMFGGPVYLEVWVRVKRGWADDDTMLKRLGY
ncbi:MAG: GTPase Era [Aromatoleum sp.]|nr:GTPase Era [Aromatoleum sp.]